MQIKKVCALGERLSLRLNAGILFSSIEGSILGIKKARIWILRAFLLYVSIKNNIGDG